MKYSSKLDILRSICITNILNCIIMLGINAPKVLAKGKYAQAVRKAALASIGAKPQKDDASKASKKHLARGNTLGISAIRLAPCKGKSLKKFREISAYSSSSLRLLCHL